MYVTEKTIIPRDNTVFKDYKKTENTYRLQFSKVTENWKYLQTTIFKGYRKLKILTDFQRLQDS